MTFPYIFGLGCKAGPQGDQHYGGYEDATLVQHVVALIEGHEPAEPMFLFWAPHVIHTPLQVPPAFFHKFDFIAATDKPTHERQIYHAMVNFADTMIGNVTDAFKRKGMWESTLMVMSTDNGGPIYDDGGGRAFPDSV